MIVVLDALLAPLLALAGVLSVRLMVLWLRLGGAR